MAKQFEGGIPYYTVARAHELEIYFPKNVVSCQYCDFCYCESELKRYRCRITRNLLYDPFIPGLPESCPFELTGEIKGTRKE